jgi:hypothetical protein
LLVIFPILTPASVGPEGRRRRQRGEPVICGKPLALEGTWKMPERALVPAA